MEDAGLFAVPRTTAAADRIDASIVREAVREERKLRIAYLDNDDQQTVRVIWPVAIAFFERVRIVGRLVRAAAGISSIPHRSDHVGGVDRRATAAPAPGSADGVERSRAHCGD